MPLAQYNIICINILQRFLFASAIVVLEEELSIHQRNLPPANTKMFLSCKAYLMAAKEKESTGEAGDEKAYLLNTALQLMVLMKTQSDPKMIYNNENDKIGKAMLMLEIEKSLFNSLTNTKVLLKQRRRLYMDDNIKKFEHIISESLYKCHKGDTFLSRFNSEAIQSALTLMIADEGNFEKLYDIDKNDLTEKTKDKLLHMMTSRSLGKENKNIKSFVSDVKPEFSICFQYIMENITCYDNEEKKTHMKKDAVRMMMSTITRSVIAPNEPLLDSVSSLALSNNPNIFCILAAVSILQPDYPKKPFSKEIVNNKKRNAASLMLGENCALLKYYSSAENLPAARADETTPSPTSGSSSNNARTPRNEAGVPDGAPGRQLHHQRGGAFHGPHRGGYRIPIAEKRMRYDDDNSFH